MFRPIALSVMTARILHAWASSSATVILRSMPVLASTTVLGRLHSPHLSAAAGPCRRGRLVANFQPVTEPPVVARLDDAARGKVLQADLKALGVSDFGEAKGGGLELFFENRPMTPARWPNEGFVRIADVL